MMSLSREQVPDSRVFVRSLVTNSPWWSNILDGTCVFKHWLQIPDTNLLLPQGENVEDYCEKQQPVLERRNDGTCAFKGAIILEPAHKQPEKQLFVSAHMPTLGLVVAKTVPGETDNENSIRFSC